MSVIAVPSATAQIEPFVVADIRVEGLQRIAPGSVFAALPVGVGDVGEGVDTGVGDEGLHLLNAVATGDPDDPSPPLELLLHGCDRTRFTATRRSPRGPEPQDDVVAFEIVRIDETATDGVLDEVVGPLGVDRVRCTAFDRGGVVGGTCHGEQGDDSRQTRE